jgi:hypothetical protein
MLRVKRTTLDRAPSPLGRWPKFSGVRSPLTRRTLIIEELLNAGSSLDDQEYPAADRHIEAILHRYGPP